MHFTIALSALMALLPAAMSVAAPEPEANININLPASLSLVSRSFDSKAVYSPVHRDAFSRRLEAPAGFP
jgi:hypothetical protein